MPVNIGHVWKLVLSWFVIVLICVILALFTAISTVSSCKRNMAWDHLSCLCAYKLSMWPDVFELSVCLQTCYMAWCHLSCLCAYKLATWPDVFELSVLTNLLHGLMSLGCLCLKTGYMAWCLWVVRAYKLASWPDIIWAVCVLTNLLLFEHQRKMEAYGVTSYSSSWRKDVTNWCLQFGLSLHCCYHPTLTQCSCSSV